MRKLFFILAIVLLSSSLCVAQSSIAPSKRNNIYLLTLKSEQVQVHLDSLMKRKDFLQQPVVPLFIKQSDVSHIKEQRFIRSVGPPFTLQTIPDDKYMDMMKQANAVMIGE